MSRLIGDRRTSALDEMEEVARARNADVAEEERLEALRKAKEALNVKAPSEEPIETPLIAEPSMEDIVDFYGTPLCRNDYDAIKELFGQINHDLKIAQEGYRIRIWNKRVTHIDLDNYLLREVPDIFGRLTQLRALHLYNNIIQKVPGSVENLQSLQEIDARSNPLNNDSKQMLDRMKARGVDVRY